MGGARGFDRFPPCIRVPVQLSRAAATVPAPPHAHSISACWPTRSPAQGLGGSTIGEYRMGGSDIHTRMIDVSSGEDDDDDDDDDIIFQTN